MPEDEDLEALYTAIVKSAYFRDSVSLQALFKYLWQHQDKPTQTINVWEECLHAFSRSEDKDLPHDQYDYQTTVRERCLELRKALADFGKQNGGHWHITLPKAVPRQGYQLKIRTKDEKISPTAKFWQAHLRGTRDLCVVYTEQLFYENWPERYAVRYYDCNEEHAGAALLELRDRHPQAYNKELIAAYPFVASGEIEARDSITRWFAENALLDVTTAITRRRNDREVWQASLILLGASPGNRMVTEILQSCPQLDIALQERWAAIDGKRFGQITVKNPTDHELKTFDRFKPVRSESECALHFSPEQGVVLAILTRVENPYSNSMITIINSDFGRAIEQIGQLVTDEDRMNSKEWPSDLNVTATTAFQILFAIPFRSLSSDHLLTKQVEPLTWRTYPGN